ncbi:MAG: hypothetical protein U0136_12375 [Bdellovibrionota bacterium]
MEPFLRDWMRGLKLFSMQVLVLLASALPIGIVDWLLQHLIGRGFVTIVVFVVTWPYLFSRVSEMAGIRVFEQTAAKKPGFGR